MPGLLQRTLSDLRRAVARQALGELTDRQLLRRFAASGDEEAFATLVRRHASLVMGVCRRVLCGAHDSEDAFQATFLVLARKASSVAWNDSVKNWLHGVAYRVSLKARRQALRRKLQERAVAEKTPDLFAQAKERWDDLKPVLDEELAALPARYRAPLILCYLEGRTRDEAAEELGWSAGSVKGRLERGREMLRQRLVRRGLPLSAVLCAGLLPEVASAAPGAALLDNTVQAGLHFVGLAPVAAVPSQTILLAQGVLNAMLVTKLKWSALILVFAGLLGFGGSRLMQEAPATETYAAALARTAPPEDRQEDLVLFPDEGERVAGKRDVGREGEGGVRGGFVSFDEVKGLITLSIGREGMKVEQNYHLAAKDVKFTSNLGEPVRPKAIPKGAILVLELNELNDVSAVRLQYPVRRLTLSGVNPERGAIRYRADDGERPIRVSPDAKLTLAGKPAKLEDFKAGTRVEAFFDMENEMVISMKSVPAGDRPREPGPKEGDPPRDGDRPKEKGPRDGDRPVDRPKDAGRLDIAGTITAVNVKEGTMDVISGGEGDPWIKTFIVPKDVKASVKMERMNKEVALAELAKATRVMFNVADDKKTVTKLIAQPPVVRFVVKSVDAEKGRVVAGDASYAVTKETEIHINRKQGTLTDLTPGMNAVGYLTFDRSRLAYVQVYMRDGAPAPKEREGDPRPKERERE